MVADNRTAADSHTVAGRTADNKGWVPNSKVAVDNNKGLAVGSIVADTSNLRNSFRSSHIGIEPFPSTRTERPVAARANCEPRCRS